MTRYLVEEGLVVREGGRWSSAGEESLASRIPEGLRGCHRQAAVPAER